MLELDPETVGVLDALLGEKKRSKAPPKVYATKPVVHSKRDWITPAVEPEPKKLDTTLNLKELVATLSVDPSTASIVLNAPMNAVFLERFKMTVPVTYRRYDETKKVWHISPAAMPALKPLLKETYKDVQTIGVPKAIPATKFDQLMAKLDTDDKNKIYRILAMKYHVDKGGDHETMTLINLVFKGGK